MKTKSRLESQNFLTSVVTLLLIALGVQGIEVTLNAEEVVREVLAKNLEFISTVLIPSVITIVFKVSQNVKNGTFQLSKLWKSPNFITQAITVLAGILTFIGILLPDTAPQALSDAIFSGSVGSIITAIIVNVGNPLWHFIQDLLKKDNAPVEPVA